MNNRPSQSQVAQNIQANIRQKRKGRAAVNVFDPTKPVQTRAGKPCGIYYSDAGGEFPIHGWILDKNQNRVLVRRRADGRTFKNDSYNWHSDFVNIPESSKPRTYLVHKELADNPFIGDGLLKDFTIETIELTPAVRVVLEKEGLI